MPKVLVFLCLLAALAACRYESVSDFRSSAVQYDPSRVFPEGRHLFVSADGNELLSLTVTAASAYAGHQTGGSAPMSATILKVLGSDQFPENSYVAFAEGAKTESGQKFHYYPFMYNEGAIWWLRPSSAIQFGALPELARHMTTGISQGKFGSFTMVPEAQRQIVTAHFQALRDEQQKNTQTSNSAVSNAPAAPPVQQTRPPQINGFAIGDGVYVQGFFADETAMIQDIDEQRRRVKVFRYSDGVSEWIAADRIISRGQSTANDFGRAAVGAATIVCLFSPDTCKQTPK